MSQSDEHDIWRTLRLASSDQKQRGLFLNLLYPKPGDMPMPTTERLEGDGFIGASVGSEDTFLFATENGEISGDGVVTDGQIAALGRKNDSVEWFLCVGGTSMEVDGQELFRSDKKIVIAMDNSGTGRILAEGTTTVTVASGNADPITLKIGAGIAVVKNGRLAAGNEH